jgi:hypothetical protein
MHRPKLQSLRPLSLSCGFVGGLLSSQAWAADVGYGEMAAAIRSANYPCTQVLKVESDGDEAWVVQCNSGRFLVSRDESGDFSVLPQGPKPPSGDNSDSERGVK